MPEPLSHKNTSTNIALLSLHALEKELLLKLSESTMRAARGSLRRGLQNWSALELVSFINACVPGRKLGLRWSIEPTHRGLASSAASGSPPSSSSKSSSSLADVAWDDMHGLEGLGGQDNVYKKMTRDERTALLTMNISAHAQKMEHYRKDTQTLANWLDLSVVNVKGRVYPPDFHVLPTTNVQCVPFPTNLPVTTLSKVETTVDDMVPGGDAGEDGADKDRGLRLITFSFKAYGYSLADSWLQPFTESRLAEKIPALNICFVEYGFLSFASGSFIGSLREKVKEGRWAHTAFAFGGVMDFATQLLLPNKFTGYAYLVDGAGRVRWRACGMATGAEVERMLKCAEGLYKEQEHKRQQGRK